MSNNTLATDEATKEFLDKTVSEIKEAPSLRNLVKFAAIVRKMADKVIVIDHETSKYTAFVIYVRERNHNLERFLTRVDTVLAPREGEMCRFPTIHIGEYDAVDVERLNNIPEKILNCPHVKEQLLQFLSEEEIAQIATLKKIEDPK